MRSKADRRGSWRWIVGLALVLGAPLYGIYAHERFRLFDTNDPAIPVSAGVGFVVGALLVAAFGKRYLWSTPYGVMWWAVVVALGAVGAMLGLGDRGPSETIEYAVARKGEERGARNYRSYNVELANRSGPGVTAIAARRSHQ